MKDHVKQRLTRILDNVAPSEGIRGLDAEKYRKKGAADKAGKGYSRSAFATISRAMCTLIEDSVGFSAWPHCFDQKSKKKTPFVPRVLLYIHHLGLCCQVVNTIEDHQLLQYFHLLFRCTVEDPSLVYALLLLSGGGSIHAHVNAVSIATVVGPNLEVGERFRMPVQIYTCSCSRHLRSDHSAWARPFSLGWQLIWS